MTALEPGYVSSLCWYMWLGLVCVHLDLFTISLRCIVHSDGKLLISPCSDLLLLRFVMMSSHSLIGLVQSFFTKSDVEAEDPMMAMTFYLQELGWGLGASNTLAVLHLAMS